MKIIKEKFGNEVAEIVVDCTDAWEDPKPPWGKGKDYLAKLPKKPHTSMLVSLVIRYIMPRQFQMISCVLVMQFMRDLTREKMNGLVLSSFECDLF